MRVPRNTGRIKRRRYWAIKVKNHPYGGKQGYVLEHRLMMEKMLGRYLLPSEVVHHKNGDPSDNSPDNLELFSSHGEHTLKAHNDLFKKQNILFKGCHFSPKTEFKKGQKSWNKGTKGLMPTPWNKGKEWSQEVKDKLSAKNSGKRFSKNTEFKKGMIPWNKGKKWTDETRRKVMFSRWNKII